MRTYILVMVMGFVLGLGGCQANQGAGLGQIDSRPMDFSLDLVSRTTSGEMERMVVFPDGAMHYDQGQMGGGLPPRVHRLDQGQMDGLWTSLREWRLNQSSRGYSPGVEVGDEDYRLTLTSRGQRWVVTGQQEEERVFTDLLEQLKEMAWVEEMEQRGSQLAHRRYDLGPDPYDRYR